MNTQVITVEGGSPVPTWSGKGKPSNAYIAYAKEHGLKLPKHRSSRYKPVINRKRTKKEISKGGAETNIEKSTAMIELKARLLGVNGSRVVEEVLRKALDKDDKDQVICLKMCMDRLLPVSHFEKQVTSKPTVQILITNGTQPDNNSTIIDVEATPVEIED